MSQFIEDVIRLTLKHDMTDMLAWNEEDDGSLSVAVICNDVFYWATADCEIVTADTLGELAQAYDDACAACPRGRFYADMLYAARRRKMRPQGAAYSENAPEMWPLFDACGPERPTDKEAFGNPYGKPTEEPVE